MAVCLQRQLVAGRLTGSSFTIKNILNLPDDLNESTVPTQYALGFGVSSPATLQLTASFPPSGSRSRDGSNCWPCKPWMTSFTTQVDPRGGFGGTDFAREPRLSLGGCTSGDDNYGLKLRRCIPRMRKKKERPLFSLQQVQKMEKEFDSKKYLTEGRRAELAVELELTETQVKTWFQNRRTKWRKELRNENPPREVPDGRLKYSIEARQ